MAVKKVNVKLRLDEELWAALAALAEKSERSVAGEMRLALRAHVHSHKVTLQPQEVTP